MNLAIAGDTYVGLLLASIRIAAWLLVVPPFASRAVPAPVKVLLSLGLATAATPTLAEADIPLTAFPLVVEAVTQAAIGAAMGLVTMMLLAAIATAGSLIDVFGGFALAYGFDPMSMQGNTVFGTFHQLLATALLFASGLHVLVIGGVLMTFRALPVGASPDFSNGPQVVVTAMSMLFVIAIQIALPVIAVLFVADLGLALLTKVAPQLNALNVMFPAKIGLTLLVLGLSFPVLVPALERLVDLSLDAMTSVVGIG